jgi:hypothetical protein
MSTLQKNMFFSQNECAAWNWPPISGRLAGLNLFERPAEFFAGGTLGRSGLGKGRLAVSQRLKKPLADVVALDRRADIAHRVGNARQNRVSHTVSNPIKEVHTVFSYFVQKIVGGTVPRLPRRVKSDFGYGGK